MYKNRNTGSFAMGVMTSSVGCPFLQVSILAGLGVFDLEDLGIDPRLYAYLRTLWYWHS